MVTRGESRISAIVAVSADGRILPPCGRCRELLVQVSHDNLATEVVLADDYVARLADLLPHRWQELF
jgi:cytidine deaminase